MKLDILTITTNGHRVRHVVIERMEELEGYFFGFLFFLKFFSPFLIRWLAFGILRGEQVKPTKLLVLVRLIQLSLSKKLKKENKVSKVPGFYM